MTPEELALVREIRESAFRLMRETLELDNRIKELAGERQLRPGEMRGPRGHVLDKLEMTYRGSHRQERHRKPARPDFDGAS